MADHGKKKAVGLPLPLMQGLHGEFYRHCAAGRLSFQRCSDCGRWRHVPREICPACSSWNWSWEQSSGHGTVYTYTIAERPMHPAFAEQCPYAAVVVEMEEGVRLLSRVVDCPPSELEIGAAVTVEYLNVEPTGAGADNAEAPAREKIVLPVFRLA